MKVKVLYFAGLCERTGCREEVYELDEGSNLRTLQERLVLGHPEIETLVSRVRWAINQKYAGSPESPLSEGDEIALIPPVSGG